jgi:hypothetical protein
MSAGPSAIQASSSGRSCGMTHAAGYWVGGMAALVSAGSATTFHAASLPSTFATEFRQIQGPGGAREGGHR